MNTPTPPVQPVIEQIQKALDAEVDAITLEQRPKFEEWAFSMTVDEEERALFSHRLPDGRYASNTARAGLAAWLSATLLERERSASKEAEAKEAALKYVSLFGELQGAMEQSGRLLEALHRLADAAADSIATGVIAAHLDGAYDHAQTVINQNQGEPK